MAGRRIAPDDTATFDGVIAAVRQAADAICDRWSLTLALAAFAGEKRFAGFMDRTGMASRLVTSRLRSLESLGVFLRVPYSRRPLRWEYELTPMGRDLAPVLGQMLRWETNRRTTRRGFVHLRCRACGAAVDARAIVPKPAGRATQGRQAKAVVHRRSTLTSRHGVARPLRQSFDIFGDKWSIEILICAFLRIRRFNELRARLGIAANILSDRLSRLVAAGLLRRATNDELGFRLTDNGLDLYGVLVAVEDWADKWLAGRIYAPLRLIHGTCGDVFHPVDESHRLDTPPSS